MVVGALDRDVGAPAQLVAFEVTGSGYRQPLLFARTGQASFRGESFAYLGDTGWAVINPATMAPTALPWPQTWDAQIEVECGRPAWATDGSRFAVSCSRQDGISELLIFEIASASSVIVPNSSGCSDPSYSAPDSVLIAFCWNPDQADTGRGAVAIDIVTGSRISLVDTPEFVGYSALLSPNGRFIALILTSGQGLPPPPLDGLYVIDVECTPRSSQCDFAQQSRLALSEHFAWSPIGDELAYSEGSGGLKIYNARAKEALVAASLPGHVLSWSPDGSWIAMLDWDHIAVIDSAGFTEVAATPGGFTAFFGWLIVPAA